MLKKDRIWDFNGGIHPPEMKAQSCCVSLRTVPLPTMFIVPLQQHLGPKGELCISRGDRVLKGQPITSGQGRAVPIHAPTSGTVNAIEPHITANPLGQEELCVHIKSDGEDQWVNLDPVENYRQLSADELIQRIHQAGIAGLGGAGFPTASKLQGCIGSVETLILNAAECEPYITADDRLMQEHSDQIIEGAQILRYILNPRVTLIGIEDNKPDAIAALKKSLHRQKGISLRIIPAKYPSGSAKQLTKVLTGKEVPHGKHSSSIGVLIQNVGTVFAIKRAIVNGEPLIERAITLTGAALSKPGNLWVRIGTSVQHLLDHAGFQPQLRPMVVMGGAFTGFTLSALNIPIVKISNCVLAPSINEISSQVPEQACIRCGFCVAVCPSGLLPQQLYWFIRGQEHNKARDYNLSDCIECGACASVCPSNIPLVQYYRKEKAKIKEIDQEAERTAEAKVRYKNKLARLAREQGYQKMVIKLSDNDKNIEQITLVDGSKKYIKRTAMTVHGQQISTSVRKERKLQTPEAPRQKKIQTCTTENTHKIAVAAAIARAKAKKDARVTLLSKANEE